ncbi:glycosyltransferase involved in cell wall biosynthesis [Silvimonas terrae]|uniref:Glycosyltransferase involved in cell wall biosynthesis n=1 Tax=Silvimonas terrae TaxID=300266 RepID=A0A840RDI2_9NEIS|nr:glycosyltransferase [Silvimonas terrae]MBB5191539.1 glycosyltransferase involved in cell wall biosynthesis [Silvimonas terrae]
MSHITHVVESFGAGTLSMVTAMANRQIADGHRVTVIHSVREETPANWRELFANGIELVQLPMTRSISPLADWRAGRLLHDTLKAIKPDVVHLHSSKAGALGRILSWIYRGPKWFFSPHGLSFLQRAEGRLKNTVFLLIEKLLAGSPVTFIACSPGEAKEIRTHLSDNVLEVHNAVDLAAITPAPGNTGVVRVGTVGRVTLARNPELFAQIAAALGKPGEIEFVWIGGGDESGESALRAAGVSISGWVDRKTALARMAELDIYIQTSRWEGMPVAVLEAMGAGLPVIATNVIGNRDLVKDGDNGYLADSATDFTARLALLAQDRHAREALGGRARQFVQQHYSLDVMMAALYTAYGFTPVPGTEKHGA